MNVEGLLLSYKDPQLGKCLEAIKNQTIQFSKLTHIAEVSPMHRAWNKAWESITEEWVGWLDGDVILYPNAVETLKNYAKPAMNERICSWSLGLYDPFLKMTDNFFCLIRSSVYRNYQAMNKASWDRYMGSWVKKGGWETRKDQSIIVGTHFEDPNDFQVFVRFFRLPQKYKNQVSWMKSHLNKLLDNSGNHLYRVALNAIIFGAKKMNYPGSYCAEFDQEMFAEFNKWILMN